MGLCLQCATWVKRRARARRDAHPSLPGRLRAGIHTVRNTVIERGWHDRGRLGALLHPIGRYLP